MTTTRPHHRWKPTRAGIDNLWRYYDETFEFADGRLLVRGRNGLGKSKALELLFPFLLDANTSSHRLSTFGGRDRTMHWNLMGAGTHGRSSRVGFCWAEFRHPDHGYLTIGARLQASTNTTKVASTYFVTTQRVGHDLQLTNDRKPLTRPELADAIGACGRTFTGDTDGYRRELAATLYRGFTSPKYQALLNGLLQLRTPKLSEHLNPDQLSALLSAALPPLDQTDVAEIAEGFEKLDRREQEIAALDNDLGRVHDLAARQKTYARRLLRRAAATLATATTRLDNVTRSANKARETLTTAQEQLQQVSSQLATTERDAQRTDGELEGLLTSDAYLHAQALEDLRNNVRSKRTAVAEAGKAATDLEADAEQDKRDADTADEAVADANQQAVEAHDEFAGALDQIGHRDLADRLATQPVDEARKSGTAEMAARKRASEEVLAALKAHHHNIDQRKSAEQAVERVSGLHTEATEARQRREQQLAEAAELYGDEIAAWAAACEHLPVAGHAEQLAQLAVTDHDQFAAAVNHAAEPVRNELADARAHLELAQNNNRDAHADIVRQLTELDATTDLPPEAPPWRTADRDGRPGAPLWAIVDVRDNVTDTELAGAEAALEAAGLLDAWVQPDGQVGAGHDSWIAATATTEDVATPTLDRWLTPAANSAVPHNTVARLLATIRCDNSPATTSGTTPATTTVGADGTFQIGQLAGHAPPRPAAHLGAAARARARETARARLTAEQDRLAAEAVELDRRAQQLDRRTGKFAEEQRWPAPDSFKAARSALATAEHTEELRRADEEETVEKLTAAERKVRASLAHLTTTATDRNLPTDPDALDRISGLLGTATNQMQAWLDRRVRAEAAATAATKQRQRAGRSHERAVGARQTAGRLEAELSTLEGKLAAAERAQDPHQDIVAEVAKTRERKEQLDRCKQQLNAEQNTLTGKVATAKSKLDTVDQQRLEADAGRRAAETHLVALINDAVHVDAGQLPVDDEPATTTALRQLGRRISDTFDVPHTDDNVRDAANAVSEAAYSMRAALAGRAELTVENAFDDVQRLRAERDGTRMPITDLHSSLSRELHDAATELTAKQTELFDRTLTGEVRRQVADRIRMASDLEAHMNRLLGTVSTASQLKVALRWRTIDDPTVREARTLLLRDPDTLSDTDRDALHRFFRSRIETARSDDSTSGWASHLLDVLDYRTWHTFEVRIDRSDTKGFVPLTKSRHGALSGGEKAVSLHLPLFAAAAAHYAASPEAPRLVLLDELFVGVDEDNRGQLLALLVALDLDLMMTSDHEWGLYPELPALAIHELLTDDASVGSDDPVTSARFEWNGQQLTAPTFAQPHDDAAPLADTTSLP